MAGDLEKLQGTWRLVALETDGQTMDAAMIGGARIVVKGDTFVSLGMGGTYEGNISLRKGKTQKELDLLFTVGHAKGTRNLGIYKLDAGRWTICLATRGVVRPKTFATKAGTGTALETFVPDDGTVKTAEKPPIALGSPTAIEGEWEMVSAVFGGNPMDAGMVKWCKRITRGNLTTIVAGPQTMLKATFALKPGKTHALIDYMNLHGANKGKAQAGIYELDGDTLKFCMSEPGKPAPADFSSKSGDGRSYTVWKRLGRLNPARRR